MFARELLQDGERDRAVQVRVQLGPFELSTYYDAEVKSATPSAFVCYKRAAWV
jgi:hypothetical protein